MNPRVYGIIAGTAQLFLATIGIVFVVMTIENLSAADPLPNNPYYESPKQSSSDGPYKTTFTLKSAFNGAITTYPSDMGFAISMPQNSAWSCEIVPVTVVKQGKRNAGFVCHTKTDEFIGIMANCAPLHYNIDRAYAKIGAGNDDRQTIDFSVSCETKQVSAQEPGF